jgi:hypothetical protein
MFGSMASRPQELHITIARDGTSWHLWRCGISHFWMYEPAWWDQSDRDGAQYPCDWAKTLDACIENIFTDEYTTEEAWVADHPPPRCDYDDGETLRGDDALYESLHQANEWRAVK